MAEQKQFNVEVSKTGISCKWEEGEGGHIAGWACIITGPEGQKFRPIYIKKKHGTSDCIKHALIPLKHHSFIVCASHYKQNFTINIYRITEINSEEGFAVGSLVHVYSEGEWFPEQPTGNLLKAVEAAKNKATCCHCNTPFYIVK